MIRIEGQYELKDYMQAVALNDRRLLLAPLPLMVVGGTALFLFFVAAAFVSAANLGGTHYVELTFVIWLALFTLWQLVIRPLRLSRELSRRPELFAPFVCEATEQGISFQNGSTTEHIHWHEILERRETKHLFAFECVVPQMRLTGHAGRLPGVFLLHRYSTLLGYRVIPKRLFEDETEVVHFREMLVANHISRRGVTSRVLAIIVANSLVVGVVVAIIVGLILLAVRR